MDTSYKRGHERAAVHQQVGCAKWVASEVGMREDSRS